MTENDRQLLLALESDQCKLLERWLKVVTGFGATLPPVDNEGRVDGTMLAFAAGAHSILHKIELARTELRKNVG